MSGTCALPGGADDRAEGRNDDQDDDAPLPSEPIIAFSTAITP